ncbi:MAG TPA: hypothetical protein VGJ00_08370 [Rhabdochlamydiaceae bacterium]|jgi:hypothetical protein
MKREKFYSISFTIALLVFSLLTIKGFSEKLVLVNRTSYPLKNEKSQIAVQWAASAKEVAEGNSALIEGLQLDSTALQFLSQTGKISLTIPMNAEYFRILVWSKEQEDPDLHTNWVDVIPNKTYTLKNEYLVPTVLLFGFGC